MAGTPLVVAAPLANKAGRGGEAWVWLSWIRGFRHLGVDTWFVEELPSSGCTDDLGASTPPESSRQVAYFREVTARFGLADRATLVVDGEVIAGPSLGDLSSVATGAALLNISGHLRLPRLLPRFRTRAFLDLDPGFTQAWHAAGDGGARVDQHDLHFTIGEAIGTPGCSIPTGGTRWRPVRQPVLLGDWPVVPLPSRAGAASEPRRPVRFTSVARWRGPYGPVTIDGRTHGLKVHEFRRVIGLPGRVRDASFELALDIDPADVRDRQALDRHGWVVVPPEGTVTPEGFRDYVQRSDAELSVAQGVYVGTASGWFSDRTVRYLASGRAAVVQDTGFTQRLPTGEGLLAFRSLDDAVTGAARVAADPAAHGAAARALAAQHFAAERVLPPVCEQLGL